MIPRQQIRTLVIRALLDNQEDSARPIPEVEQITDDFCPIGDLEGFDSYSAMEVTLELSDLLGCDIDERIFITKAEGRHANVGEIVEKIHHLINVKEAHAHG